MKAFLLVSALLGKVNAWDDETVQLQTRKVNLLEDVEVMEDEAEPGNHGHLLNLLHQAMSTAEDLHARASKGADQQVPPQPPVYIPTPDFSDAVLMPKVGKDTYPVEFHASIPIAENNVIVEANRVGIPLNHHYTGIVASRTLRHRRETTEYGDLRWILDDGRQGANFFPGSLVNFAERFHVLKRTGDALRTDAQDIQPATPGDEPPYAFPNALPRAGGLLQFAKGTDWVSTAMAGAVDPMALSSLTQYVATNIQVPESELNQARDMAHYAVTNLSSVAAGSAPLSIPTSCIHILPHNGVNIDENLVAWIPLNTNTFTVRAQLEFWPNYEMDSLFGRGFWTLSNDETKLIWRYAASSAGFWPIKRENYGSPTASSSYAYPPELHVTHPGGDGVPGMLSLADFRGTPGIGHQQLMTFADNRNDQAWMAARNYLFKQYAQVPMSFTYMFKNINDLCPPAHLAFVTSMSQHQMSMQNVMAGVITPQQFAQFSMMVIPCGVDFLRGTEDHGNALDVLEVVGFIHFFNEWPNARRMNALRGTENIAEDGWHWKYMPSASNSAVA